MDGPVAVVSTADTILPLLLVLVNGGLVNIFKGIQEGWPDSLQGGEIFSGTPGLLFVPSRGSGSSSLTGAFSGLLAPFLSSFLA